MDPRFDADFGLGYCSACFNQHPVTCQDRSCFCPCRAATRIPADATRIFNLLQHRVRLGQLQEVHT